MSTNANPWKPFNLFPMRSFTNNSWSGYLRSIINEWECGITWIISRKGNESFKTISIYKCIWNDTSFQFITGKINVIIYRLTNHILRSVSAGDTQLIVRETDRKPQLHYKISINSHVNNNFRTRNLVFRIFILNYRLPHIYIFHSMLRSSFSK